MMPLSETIFTLRTQKGLSQGELAEALGVSRQSVSKWETGASTPDLDKLLALARLFGCSLDELVSGEAPAVSPAEETPAAASPATPTKGITPRQAVGLVLLGVGLLGALLSPVIGLALLLPALPLLIAGVLCLVWPHWSVYLIAWGLLAAVFYLLPRIMGVAPFAIIFHPEALLRSPLHQLLFSLIFWAMFAALTFFTVRRIVRHLRSKKQD